MSGDPKPSVDFTGQALAVGDHVTFISNVDPGSPSLSIGRIVVIHGNQVCIESGHLVTRRGNNLRASGGAPERVRYESIYRLPPHLSPPSSRTED